jgi:tetratricopeptide (TPR) repeat protein
MGNREYAQSLQSFQKAVRIVEKDVPYDDGRAGIVVGYGRAGDALLQMKRTAEAEESYRKALVKSDLPSAIARNDVPVLQSIAGAYAGFGGLRMAMAAHARDPEEASQLRNDACGAWRQSNEIQRRLTAPVRFSSSNFPMPNLNAARESFRSCATVSSKEPAVKSQSSILRQEDPVFNQIGTVKFSD